jgi:diguanylate cyclase (GGDEF)-like protein
VHDESFRESALPRAPFVIVTVAGLLGLLLPGGTIVPTDLAASFALLFTALVLVSVPWPIRRSRIELAGALAYVGFVALLVQAQGGSARSGSFSMALMAILWIALYGDRLEGAVVVVASSGALIWLSAVDGQDLATVARKSAIWFLIAAGITFAIHHLRDRFSLVIRQQRTTIVHTESLANAVSELTALRDQDAVLRVGARVAAEFMTQNTPDSRRASYFVLDGETVCIATQHDESGGTVEAGWNLASHTLMRRVVTTLKPVSGPIDATTVGPEILASALAIGVTHGVWIPVMRGDQLHGILAVTTRDAPVDAAQSSLLISLGRVLELALDNAAAHERLEHQAMVDPLTGCANRWGLTMPPAQTGFTVIAADLDGLKKVNDTLGHEAGDGVLTRFAELVRAAVRPGDTVARVGGDEFVILLAGASPTSGRHVADRILAAVAAPDQSPAIEVSLGIASGGIGTPFEVVADRADSAMYEAKRAGGMRWSEWSAHDGTGRPMSQPPLDPASADLVRG